MLHYQKQVGSMLNLTVVRWSRRAAQLRALTRQDRR